MIRKCAEEYQYHKSAIYIDFVAIKIQTIDTRSMYI